MVLFKSNLSFLTFITVLVFGNCVFNVEAREHKDSIRPDAGNEKFVLEKLQGYTDPRNISEIIYLMVGKSGKRGRERAVKIQKKRGVIETGLKAEFPRGVQCPQIDTETCAIDYSYKRHGAALHKGVDIVPEEGEGTPVVAIADGSVVGKFFNRWNRKGIELMLRHSPKQTGLPYWIYSQYTHLKNYPRFDIGTPVKKGEKIGITSNTGLMGKRERRDALHFAILYSKSPKWTNTGKAVVPADAFWMDPNAFYRSSGPYDSKTLRNLTKDEKKIKIPYLFVDGSLNPKETKKIWPYVCKKKIEKYEEEEQFD